MNWGAAQKVAINASWDEGATRNEKKDVAMIFTLTGMRRIANPPETEDKAGETWRVASTLTPYDI